MAALGICYPPVKYPIVKAPLGRSFFFSPRGDPPPKINMEVWIRSFSFLNGCFVGSMLIFQGDMSVPWRVNFRVINII